jgi:hypothetical protein
MSDIHITAWTGEPTDPALERGEETWTVGWARFIYREHVRDSLADWRYDVASVGQSWYAPIPMTFRWDRRVRESLPVATEAEEHEANEQAAREFGVYVTPDPRMIPREGE